MVLDLRMFPTYPRRTQTWSETAGLDYWRSRNHIDQYLRGTRSVVHLSFWLVDFWFSQLWWITPRLRSFSVQKRNSLLKNRGVRLTLCSFVYLLDLFAALHINDEEKGSVLHRVLSAFADWQARYTFSLLWTIITVSFLRRYGLWASWRCLSWRQVSNLFENDGMVISTNG